MENKTKSSQSIDSKSFAPKLPVKEIIDSKRNLCSRLEKSSQIITPILQTAKNVEKFHITSNIMLIKKFENWIFRKGVHYNRTLYLENQSVLHSRLDDFWNYPSYLLSFVFIELDVKSRKEQKRMICLFYDSFLPIWLRLEKNSISAVFFNL